LGAVDVTRRVGRYEILGQLGEGGMATVYLARQLDLDRPVALKELRTFGNSDPSFARRFLREARMAGSLSHPNIVTVHDYFEADSAPFIAMEYMERGSLRPLIGQISLAQVGVVFESVLAGLDYAGQRGIVHRDLKPENVMISAEGRVKIADFGIAKARNAFTSGGSLTADGTALGTPNYMAPEQALAEEVGPWTDIYAVGIMAFEFFVGRPPFADTPQPLVLIMRQVKDPIPPVNSIDPSIDPRIARWIGWLTAKDHRDRPQSAAQAWDAFEEILIGTLGPRWQRGAGLAAAVPAMAAAPVMAATGALAADPFTRGYDSEPPTRPLGPDPGGEATAMPQNLLGIERTRAAGAVAAAAATPRRRKRRAVGIAAVVAGLLAVAAFGAMRSSSDGPQAAAARAPKPAKRHAGTSGVAKAPAATQPVAAATGSAGSLRQQAKDARRLAQQYNSAAARIDKLAATGAQRNSNALIADLMRKTARAYSRASRAAARGDAAGYQTAMGEALAAKNEVDQAVNSAPSAAAPAPAAAAAPAPASACAGDSASDDPSDDACGGDEP
jgi:hypothetical protein